jgi:hypothetical protein
MNENWGWLSTNFLNRTITWSAAILGERNPYRATFVYAEDLMKPLLDNPNLIMFLTNQHHNFTHPKVLSMPLGLNDRKNTWLMMKRVQIRGHIKTQLLFSALSDWGHRPAIVACVKQKMDPESVHENPYKALHYKEMKGAVDTNLGKLYYLLEMANCRAVLCVSGLGADSYRIWEALAMGSMPVVERGLGLDRTFYRLPVLLLDDFYEISTFIVKQAYIEALYRVNDWDYDRITTRHWQRLISEVSFSGSIDFMLDKHPVEAMDIYFTRPLVPFSCSNGCGAGTKRTPVKSCAIDESLLSEEYYAKYLP